MKMINFRSLKSSILTLIFVMICLVNLMSLVDCECTIKKGCLTRKKFMTYVTVIGKDGKPIISRSIMNYKVVYIFTDRLVFYTSIDSGSASLEQESVVELKEQESKIERVINFGEIILDCGKFKNKLCHAQEYARIDQIDSFKLVQKTIKNNPDALCLLIPFFENGYQKIHDKIAYICGTEAKDLYNIISFKQYLSRQIEFYQLNVSLDRYNGFNGLLRKQLTVVLKTKDGKKPAIAKIFNKGISFISTESSGELINYYSFYGLRKHSYGFFKVKDGLVNKKVPETWSQGFGPAPLPDCCIYLNGEQSKTVFCLGNKDGGIETAIDICKNRIDSVYQEIRIAMRGIYFSESFHEIQNNKAKSANCNSKEFAVFKFRAERTTEYAIETDCKLIMNYVNSDDYKKKFDWCKKNFADELKLELKLMSLKDERVYEAINNCVYLSKKNAATFSDPHFTELMKKANLFEVNRSFLELSSQETDDYDDDDEEITSNKKSNLKKESEKTKSFMKKPEQEEEQSEMNLLEKNLNSKSMDDKKQIKDLVYNKPNDNRSSLELQRAQIFRNTQMANLQSTHTFRHSSRENINEAYNKGSASLGKQNADEFVSFLGYLRDASSRASQLIAKKQEKKLAKLIKGGSDEDKKNGLSVPPPNTAAVDNAKKSNSDEEKKSDYVPTSSIKFSPDQ